MGLGVNWANPIERGWVLCNFVGALAMLPCVTLLLPLKVQSPGLSAAWLGGREAGLSLGMLAGLLGIAQAWTRVQGRFATRVGGAVLSRIHGAGARRGRQLVRQDVSEGVRGVRRAQLSMRWRRCQSASDSFG